MPKFEYTLTLVKGGEVNIERMIGPDEFDDEIDDTCYDVRDAHFYLTDSDGNEMVIDTDDYDDLPQIEAVEQLNEEQYLKYTCWRTTDWFISSPTPLTAEDVKLVRKQYDDLVFVDFDIEVPGVELEFDSSWDGKYCEVLIEASNPTYPRNTDDD